MWCVGSLTEEYRQRMCDLLDLYARPFRSMEPVICFHYTPKHASWLDMAEIESGIMFRN
jgi:hypothetical protein